MLVYLVAAAAGCGGRAHQGHLLLWLWHLLLLLCSAPDDLLLRRGAGVGAEADPHRVYAAIVASSSPLLDVRQLRVPAEGLLVVWQSGTRGGGRQVRVRLPDWAEDPVRVELRPVVELVLDGGVGKTEVGGVQVGLLRDWRHPGRLRQVAAAAAPILRRQHGVPRQGGALMLLLLLLQVCVSPIGVAADESR